MKKEDTKENSGSFLGTWLVMAIAAIYIILGLALLLIPGLKIMHVCYVIGVLFLLAGLIRVGEYFIREYYKNLNQYGFSVGVLFMILGICIIVKMRQVTGVFTVCLGVVLLLTSIVKVQNAMDLRALEDKNWRFFLAGACVIVVLAAIILLNPFRSEEVWNRYTYIIMVLDGILSIGSTLYLTFSMKHYEERMAAAEDGPPKKQAADVFDQTRADEPETSADYSEQERPESKSEKEEGNEE